MRLWLKVKSFISKRKRQSPTVWIASVVHPQMWAISMDFLANKTNWKKDLLLAMATAMAKVLKMELSQASVALGSMKMCRWRFATWAMGAGLITISHLKFKLGSIALPKLSLVRTIPLVQTCGALPALFSRWWRVTSCLSHAKVKTTTKTMIT